MITIHHILFIEANTLKIQFEFGIEYKVSSQAENLENVDELNECLLLQLHYSEEVRKALD